MEPNLDARLKSIEEKLEKNHQLLVKVRRVQLQGQLFKIVYWVLIILLAFGAFYFIQPYINQILDTYSGFQNAQSNFQKSFSDIDNLNSLLDQFKNKE